MIIHGELQLWFINMTSISAYFCNFNHSQYDQLEFPRSSKNHMDMDSLNSCGNIWDDPQWIRCISSRWCRWFTSLNILRCRRSLYLLWSIYIYIYVYIYICIHIYIYIHNGINVHILCFRVKSQPGGPSTSAGRAAQPRFGFALEVGADGLWNHLRGSQ